MFHQSTCPRGHRLVRQIRNAFKCDRCHDRFPSGNFSNCCRMCDYDECSLCFQPSIHYVEDQSYDDEPATVSPSHVHQMNDFPLEASIGSRCSDCLQSIPAREHFYTCSIGGCGYIRCKECIRNPNPHRVPGTITLPGMDPPPNGVVPVPNAFPVRIPESTRRPSEATVRIPESTRVRVRDGSDQGYPEPNTRRRQAEVSLPTIVRGPSSVSVSIDVTFPRRPPQPQPQPAKRAKPSEAPLIPVTEDTPEIMQCSVCFENQKNRVLSPCGHTLCSQCLTQISDKCPFCKQPFSSANNLFL